MYIPFDDYNPPQFEGTLKKIQLITNIRSYFHIPEHDEEIEQRLTITSDGRVWISRYCFDSEESALTLMRKESFSVSYEAVNTMMEAVTKCFDSGYKDPEVLDAAYWDLTLTNSENTKFVYSGPIISDHYLFNTELSEIIRTSLGRNDLFVFDGNPDEVTRVEVKYNRFSKIKPKNAPDENGDNFITWDYHEELTIDRKAETLEHIIELGSGCKITKTYHVEGGIISLLDDLYVDAFTEIRDNPPDTIDDPLDRKDYEISVFTKLGKNRVITGTYDKNGLPTDWADFIERVLEFMQFYEPGELFDKRIYSKAKRRESDLIFCKVKFDGSRQEYTYLADTDDYAVDDMVVVPAGPDNTETVVKIVSVEYRQPENAPFPVEKTKHILRKHDIEPDPPAGTWKNLFVPNSTGSENGLILRDEEYAHSCRITLEKCPTYCGITCGVYGAMFHTAFCNYENGEKTYEAMKKELQEFIDSNADEEKAMDFFSYFTSKY